MTTAPQVPGLRDLLEKRRLALFVGEGGVGKTSCAAGLALALAAEGRRVAVLTIDPAPRLGDALGLEAIDADWREVGHDAIRRAGGRLVASRLDTKRVFDRLVTRFAPSPAVADRILASPIYATVSDQLSGADSYMAFQQLHELLASDEHDVLVVDTPPAQHADEILGAPRRLARLLETGAVAVVADPALAIARAGSRVAGYTVAFVLKLLERVTGSRLRADLADFAGSFQGVLAALTRRASEVTDALRSTDTLVIEVVRPHHRSVVAAQELRRSLAAAGLCVELTLVNRMTPPASPAERPTGTAAQGAPAPEGSLDAEAAMAEAMRAIRAEESAAVDEFEAALVREHAERDHRIVRLSALEKDVESPDVLLELGRKVLAS